MSAHKSGRLFASSYEIAECLIGLLGSASNFMVLVAISKERRLRTITNCFVGSLAASDVLVGMLVPPITVLSQEGMPRYFAACVLLNSFVILFSYISVLNLLSVALERFLAIRSPFLYNRCLTVGRAMLLVAVTWVVAIFIGLVPIMGWHAGEEGFSDCRFDKVMSLEYMVYFIFFVWTLPPLIAMCVIYFYIFTVVRKTKQAIKLLMVSQGKDKFKKSLKNTSRGDLGVLLVIVLFLLCWMPFHIINCIQLFGNSTVSHELYQASICLLYTSDAADDC